MTAMDIMVRCREGIGDLQRLSETIARLEDCATSAVSRVDRVGGRGAPRDKLADFAAAIDEAQRAMDARRKRFDVELLAACRLVDRLDEPTCGVIYRFYVQGQTVSGIAQALNYSPGYVKQLKKRGTTALGGIAQDELDELLPAWYRDGED